MKLFLDTNTLLHFKPITDVDWCRLTSAANVELVICMPVIHELDEKKRDARLGERAKRVLRELEAAESSDNEIRPGVTCRFDLDESTSPSQLSRDDQIIEILQKAASNEDSAVGIATSDTAMRLKCKAKSIQTYRLVADDELPLPNSEEVKKRKSLERKVASLEARQPILSLLVSAGVSSKEPSTIAELSLLSEIDLATIRSTAEIRQDIPLIGPRNVDMMPTVLTGLSFPSRDQCDQYNKELMGFYDRYDLYRESINACNALRGQSVTFVLWVFNSGTQVAKNIDLRADVSSNIVRLCFASGKDDWTVAPSPPDPPPKPKGGLRAVGGIDLSTLSGIDHALSTIHRQPTEIYHLHDGIAVTHHEDVLKHGDRSIIGSFVARWSKATAGQAYQLTFRITCEEAIAPFEGAVTLKIV